MFRGQHKQDHCKQVDDLANYSEHQKQKPHWHRDDNNLVKFRKYAIQQQKLSAEKSGHSTVSSKLGSGTKF